MEMDDKLALPLRRRTPINELVPQLREKLQVASDSQKELASARQELLIYRRRVKMLARKAQLSRIDVGDAGAALLKRLREYLATQQIAFPTDLHDAFDKYEALQKDFGVHDSGYMQAEQELSAREWSFMDQETDFYQYGLPIPTLEEWVDFETLKSAAGAPEISRPEPLMRKSHVPYRLNTSEFPLPSDKDATSMGTDPYLAAVSSSIERNLDHVLAGLGSWQEAFEILIQDQTQRLDRKEAIGVPVNVRAPNIQVCQPLSMHAAVYWEDKLPSR
ncbi:hypothetical protein IAQ61_007008 [Plenodomus lingam]|nr:hypothetical protein IAQ61_007008 [Plenodomus lingam]